MMLEKSYRSAQFLAQVRVLGEQAAPLVLDGALDLQRLRNHRGDYAQELDAAVEVASSLVVQEDPESAGRLPVDEDRHADEAELAARQFSALCGAVEQLRFAADPRHDNRPVALHHSASDALADPVAKTLRRALEAVGRFDTEVSVVVQQRDDAAHRVMPPGDNFEEALQRRLEVEGPR